MRYERRQKYEYLYLFVHIYPVIYNGLYSDNNERRVLCVTTIAINSNIHPLSQEILDGDSLNQLVI